MRTILVVLALSATIVIAGLLTEQGAFGAPKSASTQCEEVEVEIYISATNWPEEERCEWNRFDSSRSGVGIDPNFSNAYNAAVAYAESQIDTRWYVSCAGRVGGLLIVRSDIVPCP